MLAVNDLTKSYRQPNGQTLDILDVPNYSIMKGEQAVLVGASGGGKTTLLHIIAGITRPTSGTVKIDDVDTTTLSEVGRDRVRAAKIGYVFQTFNLLNGFSAFENVVLGMTFAKGQKQQGRAKELLDRVGLSHRMSHKPSKMSVGEQQRVAVARALANKPRLLLADEPTANVDPKNKQQIIDLIRESCSREGIALILVTHSMEVAGQFQRVDHLQDINRIVKQNQESA